MIILINKSTYLSLGIRYKKKLCTNLEYSNYYSFMLENM
jgi:hypothetical protein